MSGLLNWQDGTAAHRGALSTFTCTDVVLPRRSRTPIQAIPKWWEAEVQKLIRGLKLPGGPHRFTRVGFDSEGLAAVITGVELDGPDYVELEYAALERRLRDKGGGYADEMMKEALDAVTARGVAAGIPEVRVLGMIYEGNRPSQDMCRRHGFRHTSMGAPGVQAWTRGLPIAGAF